MATQNITASVEPLLMILYSKLYHAIYRDHPVLGLATKKELYGKSIQQTVRTGPGGGRGHAFATAQANFSDATRYAFLAPQSWTYGYSIVQNTDLRAAAGNKGAIYDLFADCMDAAMQMCSDDTENILMGDGFGTLGTISSNTGGGPYVLTLTVVQDALKFDIGMVLVSAATPAAASIDAGTATVTKRDITAGTITVAATGGWTPTNTHVLAIQSNKIASATNQLIYGLQTLIPLTDPTDTIYGVDRSVDPVGLAGWRQSDHQGSIVNDIKRLANQQARFTTAKPETNLVSYTNFDSIENLIDNKTRYQIPGREAQVFYEAFKIGYAKGTLAVIAHPTILETVFYNLQMDSWIFYSSKNQPVQNANLKGPEFITDNGSDATQIRMVSQHCFLTDRPWANGVGAV